MLFRFEEHPLRDYYLNLSKSSKNQTNRKEESAKMPNLKLLSIPSKDFLFKVFSFLFLITISSCSRDEDSSSAVPSEPVSDRNAGKQIQTPSAVVERLPSGQPSLAETKLEGPDGDMDGDGIPNSKDPEPLVPDENSSSLNPVRNNNLLEGPDGDMDGDGIPNSKDPKPLEKQVP